MITKMQHAKIITLEESGALRYPLSENWIKAAGILKGRKRVNALRYQKQIRTEWEKRLRKLERFPRV